MSNKQPSYEEECQFRAAKRIGQQGVAIGYEDEKLILRLAKEYPEWSKRINAEIREANKPYGAL